MKEMIPRDESDEHSAVLELRAGMCTMDGWMYILFNSHLLIAAGGVESSLFTAEMFMMYQK